MRQRSGRQLLEKLPFTAVHIFSRYDATTKHWSRR